MAANGPWVGSHIFPGGHAPECKWVGNKACAMPWCHGVGDFEVTTSRF